ncbi:MAG: hypothetical protein RI572_10685 [Salegentibacter sp.]|uniref:Uncharacterized protein n=1 Tax=Salegentibacter flavus TaxID=287099 RepID=A0A1I5DH44_9FLAO|nr:MULTISPECIES: hypothetical protein [Salegentibacter]MDR9457861.1 hypothetical protein [Salegentibacter sp.]SFN98447.1 hypothetical protein SAMN05660413_03333 [Salegentibacter flavus]
MINYQKISSFSLTGRFSRKYEKLGIFSCSKDDDNDTNGESDFISATINEENWNGAPEVYLDQEKIP